MTQIPVILDCNPGLEGAIIPLLALASSETINLLGITTVGQNYSMDQRDVKVFKGCPRPFFPRLSPIEREQKDVKSLPPSPHAVNFIIETLLGASEKITIACTGSLTNIACALIKETRIKEKIEKIVLRGGAIGLGNKTPSAESNFYEDPHAAYRVFISGIPLVMIALDCLRKTQLSEGEHDTHVIAYLLNPELYKGREAYVEIDISSTLMTGRSTVDWYGKLALKPNAYVINDVNGEGFVGLLTEKLQGYGEREERKICNYS